MAHLLAPSLLSADFANLLEDINVVNNSEADWFHLDVMDGVFVPNISFGFPVIKCVKKHARKPLDVHLMIVDPGRFIDDFAEAGADVLTVHYEACIHLHRVVSKIKSLNMKAGVSLNPHTPVSVLEEIICEVDVVLLMSVNPGFGGQKFIPSSIEKIKKLKALINEKKAKTLIQVDGGVDNSNVRILVGADVLVAGNAVFGAKDKHQAIKDLKLK
jgi:ribulose-phosphate 3-epimerase